MKQAPPLFPFQAQAVNLSLNSYQDKTTNDMVVIPTGCGKTRVPAELSKELLKSKPSATFGLIAHRDFLYRQAADEFKTVMPNMQYGFFNASQKSISDQFIFISKDSMHKQAVEKYFTPDSFDVLYIDEVHHASDSNVSYTHIIDFFECKKYGYTATPYNSRGSLSAIWNTLLRVNVSDMIRQGYLCPAACIRVKTNCSIAEVRKSNNIDGMNQRDLQKVINVKARNRLVVDAYETLLKNHSCIVYAQNKEHVKNIYDEFIEAGYGDQVAYVVENTPQHEREEINKRLKDGRLKIIINCMIYTEGFNYPALQSIIITRPLGSRTLAEQIIGRVLRKHETKDYAKVVLLSDKPGQHKLFTLRDIEDGFPDDEMDLKEAKEKLLDDTTEERENIWLTKIEQIKAENYETEDLFRGEKFLWVRDIATGVWRHDIDGRRRAESVPLGNGNYMTQYIEEIERNTSLDWSIARAEAFMSTSLPIDMAFANMVKDGNITPKQRKLLANIFKRTEQELKFLSSKDAGGLIALCNIKKGQKFDHRGRKIAEAKFHELKRQYYDNLQIK